ncbi:MAG: iron-containing alcohol dehydrogenase [Candidatus Ornithomonoglobus sp.]
MSYIWNVPTKVLFGAGKLGELHNEIMPGKKALLVISNGKSVIKNGALEKTENELKKAGVDYVVFNKIQANPLEENIMEGVSVLKENGCDFVIGLGGGSVLDSATVISAMAANDGTVWDYMQGGHGKGKEFKNKPLPYIEITTSAGTGSEVDCWGVVTNPEHKEKMGIQGGYPYIAVVDPELMLSVPADYTAYQGFDALFHSVEGYISKFSNEMSEVVELAAISNIASYLPRAVKNGSDLEARTKVAFANTMSGYSMEVGSCTSEHALEHAMSAYHQELPHGAGLIMISVAYFTHFIEKHICDERFVDMARAMGASDAKEPSDFITALKALQKACGVDNLKMSDYGIKPDEFKPLAENAKATMGGLFFCDRTELSTEDCIKIYEKSYR